MNCSATSRATTGLACTPNWTLSATADGLACWSTSIGARFDRPSSRCSGGDLLNRGTDADVADAEAASSDSLRHVDEDVLLRRREHTALGDATGRTKG